MSRYMMRPYHRLYISQKNDEKQNAGSIKSLNYKINMEGMEKCAVKIFFNIRIF